MIKKSPSGYTEVNMHILETDLFQLELSLMNYGTDICARENTVMNVKCFCDDFSAVTSRVIHMDVFENFANDLIRLSETKTGKAGMYAKDGSGAFIEFSGTGSARIAIRGCITSTGNSGYTQKMLFENEVDVERLKEYADTLCSGYCTKKDEEEL